MKPFRLMVTLSLGLLVAAPCAASDYTVGQFVQQLASSKRVDAASPVVAAASLAAVGARIPSTIDLSKPLTEGDVVEISRSLGLRVTTSRPEAAFDRLRVDRFLGTFAAELGLEAAIRGENDQGEDDQGDGGGDAGGGDADGDGPPFDPFSKGKGKGKQIVTETGF